MKAVAYTVVVMFLLAACATPNCFARTNKPKVQASVEAGDWNIVWGKEIDHLEYGKCLAAIAASLATDNPAPIAAYFEGILKDTIEKFGKNAVLNAFKHKGDIFGDGDFQLKAGIATYKHWTIEGGPLLRIYVPRPNTHQPYIAWRRKDKAQVADSRDGDSAGSIWRWEGGNKWERLDPKNASAVAASGNKLYQISKGGSVWTHEKAQEWQVVEPENAQAIAADGDKLFQLSAGGSIWQWQGDMKWKRIEPANAQQMAASGGNLYQVSQGGSIWKWRGEDKWDKIEAKNAIAIAADGDKLFQIAKGGSIWMWQGGDKWKEIESKNATAIAAAGERLFQIAN